MTARGRSWGTPHEGFVRGLPGVIKAGWHQSPGCLQTKISPDGKFCTTAYYFVLQNICLPYRVLAGTTEYEFVLQGIRLYYRVFVFVLQSTNHEITEI